MSAVTDNKSESQKNDDWNHVEPDRASGCVSYFCGRSFVRLQQRFNFGRRPTTSRIELQAIAYQDAERFVEILGKSWFLFLTASQTGFCRVNTSASVMPSDQISDAGRIFPSFASGGS